MNLRTATHAQKDAEIAKLRSCIEQLRYQLHIMAGRWHKISEHDTHIYTQCDDEQCQYNTELLKEGTK